VQYSQTALQQAVERRLLINRFDSWIFDRIAPYIGSRVLEIGCGAGNLTRHLLDRDLVVGVDISAQNVDAVRNRYAEYSNLHVVVADAADRSILDLRHHQFDTIISLNVLEHIEEDVRALGFARQLLTPGGRLILIVPAHQRLYGTMDTSIGHYRRYSLAGVDSKFAQAGLQVISHRYLNPVGAVGWFVNGRILRRQVAPEGQLKLFNTLVPLITAVDGAIRWPFGLSVLAVGKPVVDSF
jgi:SAM-dependent methyltransferase